MRLSSLFKNNSCSIGKAGRKDGKDMEKITVKEVNGYKVEKYANTHGQYFVNIREGNGFREFHTFRTIKDAVKFIETAL